jgi:hypothetical protein
MIKPEQCKSGDRDIIEILLNIIGETVQHTLPYSYNNSRHDHFEWVKKKRKRNCEKRVQRSPARLQCLREAALRSRSCTRTIRHLTRTIGFVGVHLRRLAFRCLLLLAFTQPPGDIRATIPIDRRLSVHAIQIVGIGTWVAFLLDLRNRINGVK